MRINRKLNDENRFEINSIVKALIVSNKEIEEGLWSDYELHKGENVDKEKLFSKKTMSV